MKIAGKTVCVTGAAGFIGSALCRELVSRDAKVVALDNFAFGTLRNLKEVEDDLEIVTADVRDLATLSQHIPRCQVVFHLGAIDNRETCQKDFELGFDVNVKGTANVLSLCSNVERVILASSTGVYGESQYLPMDERHPLEGYEPYAVTKIAAEYLCRAYHFNQNVPYTIIRNCNTYGPKQANSSLIPTLIIEALTKNQIEVWTPGVVRDLQYIDDCVGAFIKVAESDSTLGETVNLGTGKGVTTGDIADIICDYLQISWMDLKKPPPVGNKLISDASKVKALTGWETKMNLQIGLKRTIEYYKSIGEFD